MVALATMMTSCLTGRPRDQLYEEDIYNNANNIYINAVAVLYNYIGGSADSEGLQGTCHGIYDYNTLTTDEAMIPIRGGDWYDGGLWTNMYQQKWSPNDFTTLQYLEIPLQGCCVIETNLCISSISIAITYLRSREWPTKLRCEL